MFEWLVSLLLMIRVIPSPTVPGILDLQRPTANGWETYNNIALLVEADGRWNSAELDGGAITETAPGYFTYAPLANGARVQVHIERSGFREIEATAVVLSGNVTRLALSNDYGIATGVRFVASGDAVADALAFPVPNDGYRKVGDFYPVPVGPLSLLSDGFVQYQRAPGAFEAFIEVRRTPWAESQPDPGRNWIERVHLTRAGGGVWAFGYSESRAVLPMVGQ